MLKKLIPLCVCVLIANRSFGLIAAYDKIKFVNPFNAYETPVGTTNSGVSGNFDTINFWCWDASAIDKDISGALSITNFVTIQNVEYGYSSNYTSFSPVFVMSIGDFSNCSNITSVAITNISSPESSIVQYGGRPVSYWFSNLRYTYYSNKTIYTAANSLPMITNIAINAFKNCVSLKSFSSPEQISMMQAGIFDGCINLEECDIGFTNIVENGFKGLSKLKAVEMSHVIGIGNSAFDGCTNLRDITIGSALRTIGSRAFYDCSSLGEFIAPTSLTAIGDEAFNGCDALTNITFRGNAPVCADNAFVGVGADCVIRVLRTSSGWGNVPGVWKGVRIEYIDDGTRLVSFDSQCESAIAGRIVVMDGEIGVLPIPERVGYFFKGWYSQPESGIEIQHDTIINSDVIIYAQWERDMIRELDSGETVSEALANSADEMLKAKISTKRDYNTFCSWVDAYALDHKAVRYSPNAWLSFALDSPGLVAKGSAVTKEDLKFGCLDKIANTERDYDLIFGIEDVLIGEESELEEVFAIEGSETLDDSSFSTDGLQVTYDRTDDGKVKATITPPAGKATYFMRVKVK